MTYTHLSQAERYQIQALRTAGHSIGAVASVLGRHPSSISRELRRNGASRTRYKAEQAHRLASLRQTSRRNARQFSELVWALVHQYLQLDLSPEQVSARLKLEARLSISHTCIYHYVRRQGKTLIQHLRCRKRRKTHGLPERRGQLKGRVGIEQRPAVVDARTRIGDWEGDTIVSGGHRPGVLVTLAERRTRYTLVAPVSSGKAEPVAQAMIELLSPHRNVCHTITLDNGKEFAEHAFIAKRLGAKVYFADPYCSWQRGLNENHNGLLRQYFAKGSDLGQLSLVQVQEAMHRLNHRPRKCLGWKTPHEVFYGFEVLPLTLDARALCS